MSIRLLWYFDKQCQWLFCEHPFRLFSLNEFSHNWLLNLLMRPCSPYRYNIVRACSFGLFSSGFFRFCVWLSPFRRRCKSPFKTFELEIHSPPRCMYFVRTARPPGQRILIWQSALSAEQGDEYLFQEELSPLLCSLTCKYHGSKRDTQQNCHQHFSFVHLSLRSLKRSCC
jgi:hypothetical protein